MDKFEKQIYAEINGEDVYYSKIKSRLKVTSILTIIALSSILSEKNYNHTKGISPIAKILDIVKLPNNELSLGNIIQLKGMENDLKKENINSNSYYYDYVILKDEIKVSKEDAINFKSDKNYRLIEKEVKQKFDGVDLFLEDLMVDKKYSLVSEKKLMMFMS